MALGPFAAGFGQSLSLGAQLGLQYQREAREAERFAYLQQKDDRDQGLKVIESLGNIYKAPTSMGVKKAQTKFLFDHLEKATGQPINPEIREVFQKANEEDVGMILNQATTLFKTDPTMGISLLMQGLGMDANKAMDYFVNYGKLQEQQLDYQANIEAGLGPAPTTPVHAPTPPARQGPPLALQGPTRLRAMAEDVARRRGIPVHIFASLITQESAWNPQARSSAGAMGLGQLMPGTAQELGVDPTNVQQNLEGAATYLRQQYDRYGDWGKALTAYHSGPGNVDRGTIGPVGQRYAPEVLGRAGATVPTPAVTPEIRAIDEAIGSLEADVDRWRTLRGTTQIKERIANAEQKITRLQTRRGQLQTGQHQAATETRLARGEQRAERIEARQERESLLNPDVEAARVRIAQAEGQAKADVAEANLRYTPQQQKQLASLNETLTSAEVLMDIPDAQIDKWVGILKNPLQRARQAINPDPEFLAFQNTIDQLKASLLFSREEGGGGALTPTEYGALEAFLPTGRETGGTAQIRVKLQQLQQRLGSKLQTIEGLGRAKPGEAGDILRRQREQARQMRQGRGPVEVIPGTTVEEIP